MIHEVMISFSATNSSSAFSDQIADKSKAHQILATVIADLHEHSGSYCIVVRVVGGSSLGEKQKITDLLQDVVKSLTKREVEILELAVNGYSNKRIAQELFITIETVKSHRKNIVSKAGVRKIDEIKNLLLQKSLR